jgi:hypothetical protein
VEGNVLNRKWLTVNEGVNYKRIINRTNALELRNKVQAPKVAHLRVWKFF